MFILSSYPRRKAASKEPVGPREAMVEEEVRPGTSRIVADVDACVPWPGQECTTPSTVADSGPEESSEQVTPTLL